MAWFSAHTHFKASGMHICGSAMSHAGCPMRFPPYLWVRMTADDEANWARTAFTQNGISFAQSCMSQTNRIGFQDLIPAAEEKDSQFSRRAAQSADLCHYNLCKGQTNTTPLDAEAATLQAGLCLRLTEDGGIHLMCCMQNVKSATEQWT